MIVEPTNADEVLFALRVATDHRLPIAVRGSGHSQSGQCLSEGCVMVDMLRLRGLHVDPSRAVIVAEGGATWRSMVDAAFTQGFLPRGLTLVVDSTVAGTLSVGGVGGESFRVGAQVNNAVSIDIATLDGHVLSCSPDENRELFDVARAGLGQCGVILRATYPLRRCKRRLRTHFLVYEDPAACVNAITELHTCPRSELLLGFVAPPSSGRNRCTMLLALGKEFDGEAELDDDAISVGLKHASLLPTSDSPLWTESGIPGHLFFRMYSGRPWSEALPPDVLHPWVDHVFAQDAAVETLESVVSNPPALLRMGTSGIIPVAQVGDRAPLLAFPPAQGLLIGLGLFPSVPAALKDIALPLMGEYSRTLCAAGGKRYLSGFVDFASKSDWAEHYGGVWSWFSQMKRRYDPLGLLNPGFFNWS